MIRIDSRVGVMRKSEKRGRRERRGFGWKRFFIIPALFFAYLFFLEYLVSGTVPIGAPKSKGYSAGGEVITMGDAISVYVTRPYLFGTMRLPVYTSSTGDIAFMHDMFFGFLGLLSGVFVALEAKNLIWG